MLVLHKALGPHFKNIVPKADSRGSPQQYLYFDVSACTNTMMLSSTTPQKMRAKELMQRKLMKKINFIKAKVENEQTKKAEEQKKKS